MASWMIHLRVAQLLYQQLNIEPVDAFILGNIAPLSKEDMDAFVIAAANEIAAQIPASQTAAQ